MIFEKYFNAEGQKDPSVRLNTCTLHINVGIDLQLGYQTKYITIIGYPSFPNIEILVGNKIKQHVERQ